MLTIVQYKEIIRGFWGINSRLEENEDKNVKFSNFFSFNVEKIEKIDDKSVYEIGKVPSKEKGLKWFDPLNSYRNKIMHRATRAQGLTRSQVNELSVIQNTIEFSNDLYNDLINV